MNVGAIRDGLKARLATVPGLKAYDTIPEDVVLPAAVVVPDEPFITYNLTINRGNVTLFFRVTLLASRTAIAEGQDRLDAYLSTGANETKSAVDALYGDPTLGGAASSLVVTRVEDYGTAEIAGVQCLKADLMVEVHATRSP